MKAQGSLGLRFRGLGFRVKAQGSLDFGCRAQAQGSPLFGGTSILSDSSLGPSFTAAKTMFKPISRHPCGLKDMFNILQTLKDPPNNIVEGNIAYSSSSCRGMPQNILRPKPSGLKHLSIMYSPSPHHDSHNKNPKV